MLNISNDFGWKHTHINSVVLYEIQNFSIEMFSLDDLLALISRNDDMATISKFNAKQT